MAIVTVCLALSTEAYEKTGPSPANVGHEKKRRSSGERSNQRRVLCPHTLTLALVGDFPCASPCADSGALLQQYRQARTSTVHIPGSEWKLRGGPPVAGSNIEVHVVPGWAVSGRPLNDFSHEPHPHPNLPPVASAHI